jgi:hypothetical protein
MVPGGLDMIQGGRDGIADSLDISLVCFDAIPAPPNIASATLARHPAGLRGAIL